MAPAGMAQPQFSSAMVLPPGGLQMNGPAAGAYSTSQPVQLVAAVGPDGSIAQYPLAQGGMPAMYSPAMYSPAGQAALSMPMQQAWAVQQGQMPPGAQHMQQQGAQQHGQQQLQLVQVPKPVEGLGQAGAHEGFMLAQPSFSSGGQSRPMDSSGFAILAQGGASVVNAPVAPSPSAGRGPEAGPSHVDDLAQQMGGWHIT